MRFAALLFTIELICGIQSLAAQGRAIPGQRVRITSERHGLKRMIGRVLTATNDTITIGIEQGAAHDTLALALGNLDRLEIGQYTGRRTYLGARIGLAVGATIGFVVGVATYKECVPQQLYDCLLAVPNAAAQGVVGSIVVGLVGAGVGGFIGTLTRAEQWDEITTRHTQVSVRSLPMGGVGLGLAVHF